MLSKNKELFQGFVFVFFFIAQQAVAFIVKSPTLTSLYWLVVFAFVFLIWLKLPRSNKIDNPLWFTLLFIFGTILNMIYYDSSIGYVLTKILLIWVSYVGFLYIRTYKINLKSFNYLIIFLYIFFYFIYFSHKEISVNLENEGDLFGHSSSNAISILLDVILSYYYILNKYYKTNHNLAIFIFAIINFIMILIQGSRAGVIIALVLLIMSFVNVFSIKKKKKTIILIVLIPSILVFTYLKYVTEIETYLYNIGFSRDINLLEEDSRGRAVVSFFNQIDFQKFIFGFSPFAHFDSQNRTFNSFLDIIVRYGFLPFVSILYLSIKRIIFYKNYTIPIISFLPVIMYSFSESIFAFGFWNIMWYFLFFIGSNNYVVSRKDI